MNSETNAKNGIKQSHATLSLLILPQIEIIIKKNAIDHNPSGRLYFIKSEGV